MSDEYATDHASNPCTICQAPPGVGCQHDEPLPVSAKRRQRTDNIWRYGAAYGAAFICSSLTGLFTGSAWLHNGSAGAIIGITAGAAFCCVDILLQRPDRPHKCG